jgi:hypothetical protein
MNEINDVPLTAEEIKEQRDNALNATHPASWVWNEELVSWVAPIDPPTDGFPYLWNDETESWDPFPDYPRE